MIIYGKTYIHVQYCDILGFTVLHNRHHKVSQSVPFFMQCTTVTILLRIRVRGHFVMSITKNHEYHYVTVLVNAQNIHLHLAVKWLKTSVQLTDMKWYIVKCFIYGTVDVKSSKLWSSQLWIQSNLSNCLCRLKKSRLPWGLPRQWLHSSVD